ncbi:hypothetical protein R7E49_23295 [Vibrio sp. Vb2110]|uniref:hypothetical protein n=1 Tax=Vibrio TaxID=662 RepID=UPI0005437207|nr:MULTISPECIES: hypothetical protein [Vibrio]KHF15228.1 hypothetical protein PO80_12515 [Vibrio parahaemolyticus]MDF4745854.1 hypothetical protein [Vibrio parahaemolyticus]MDG3409907.1 hypothetical protein [Vibrio parahaemolyticus]MDS1791591.1 hypothetical protein [Vibrio parahaemolyticus]MDW1848718.1 hypothetical protein [Vibrio sp. Vb2130]
MEQHCSKTYHVSSSHLILMNTLNTAVSMFSIYEDHIESAWSPRLQYFCLNVHAVTPQNSRLLTWMFELVIVKIP